MEDVKIGGDDFEVLADVRLNYERDPVEWLSEGFHTFILWEMIRFLSGMDEERLENLSDWRRENEFRFEWRRKQ